MIANEKLPSSVYSFQKSWTVLKKGWETLVEDYGIVMKRDPAAKNWLEVFLLCVLPAKEFDRTIVVNSLAIHLNTSASR